MSYLLEMVKAVLRGFRSPRETAKSILGVSLYRNTIFLLVQSVVQALSGFVFWIIATKIYTPEEVGIGSALVSAMLLLAFIGTLGMGIGIIRFLPDAGDRNRLLNSTFSVCVIAALAFAITFTGGLQLWSPRLAFLQGNAVFFCLFVFFVITSSFSTTLIQVFIGFRRSDYSFFYSLITLVRLALLLPFARLWGAFGILAAWGAGEAIALSTCLLFILPRLSRGYRPVPYIQGSILTKMLGFTSANYVAEIFRGIPAGFSP